MAPSPSPPGTAAHSFSSSDPGFEALPLVPVLALHQGLLARIKLCFGADRATFGSHNDFEARASDLRLEGREVRRGDTLIGPPEGLP